MRFSWPKLFALVFAVSGSAHAESDSSVTLGGRIYTDQYLTAYSSPNYSSGILQSSLSAWMDFRVKPSERTSFLAVAQFDAFLKNLSQNEKASFSSKIREGVFTFQTESTELKIGQQIIPWGKSDGVNPTDYFSAKDYTLLNPDEEVKRLGAPAMMLNYTPKKGASPVTFTGIVQAAYPQTKLIIPNSAVPTGVAFQKYPNAPAMFQDNTMEYGGKIAYLGNDLDLSLSVFRGVNHFAQYFYETGTNQILPTNVQQSAVGGDLSFTAGAYVVRAESAYIMPDQGSENTPLYGILQPTHWDTVIGAERSFFEDFRAQIQFLYRYHVGYIDPSLISTPSPALTLAQQKIARANALLLNFQRESNPGATFRFGYASDSSDWNADLFIVGYFAKGYDYLVRPQVGYKPAEGWKLTAGADLYGGNESRPLGALKNNSSLFFEGRYVF
jgi:hypothetical protein